MVDVWFGQKLGRCHGAKGCFDFNEVTCIKGSVGVEHWRAWLGWLDQAHVGRGVKVLLLSRMFATQSEGKRLA
jgi:hypothetical protein